MKSFTQWRKPQTKQTKKIYEIGKNTCKWYNWQEVSIQNLQTTHTTQYQKPKQSNHKTKQPNQKMKQKTKSNND